MLARWQRRPIPETPQPLVLSASARMLLVKLATPGDVLLMLPALRVLRQRYPEARIDLLTTPVGASLVHSSPLLDHVYTLDKYPFDSPTAVLRRPWQLLALVPPLLGLRRTRYDAVLLLHHLTLAQGRIKFRALVAAIGACRSIGLDNGWGSFLSVRVPDHGFGSRHEAEYALDVVAAADAHTGAAGGLTAGAVTLADLGWTRDSGSEATAPGIGAASAPVVALHPGAGRYSLARRWPTAHYATLAQRLHQRFGATITLVGGSEERALHVDILARLEYPVWASSVGGSTSPQALARRLRQCALFVGNDSFPMHLASACGIPVVAIFGPTNVRAWGPYTPGQSERVCVVRRTDLVCSPCIYRGHSLGTPQGCPPRPCLTELEPARVFQEAVRLLERWPTADAPAG